MAIPLKRQGRGFATFGSGDTLPVANGGTGATTAATAATALGLGTSSAVTHASLSLTGAFSGTTVDASGYIHANGAEIAVARSASQGGVYLKPGGNGGYIEGWRPTAQSARDWYIGNSDGTYAYFSAENGCAWNFVGSLRPRVNGNLVVSQTDAMTLAAYTVATLPAGSVGTLVYASNGRKGTETAGNGTGVIAYFSGGAWRRLSDDTAVAA
ncbi:hypothetical protein [Methylobacterium sp. JK268]